VKQSSRGSAVEALTSTAVGFGLSLFLQWLYFDRALGFELHFGLNFLFAVIMTVVSFGRGYLIRRLFERFGLRIKLSPAAHAILAERQRQITQEGWTHGHDDNHPTGELALAGAAYAAHVRAVALGSVDNEPPPFWPWSLSWWKPQDIRRNLVRAAALILAELESYDRNRPRTKSKIIGASGVVSLPGGNGVMRPK
jgi:hypothetical protein